MPHERRSGLRHAVLLSVELRHAGNESRVCRVHNIAPEGMLLENNTKPLNIGSEVELQITRNDVVWNIPAVVTHCNSNCIGVMFSQRQSEFYRTVTQPPTNFGSAIGVRNFLVSKPY